MSSVDTSLHPHTSRRAAQFAKAHSTPNPLVLYGGWFCPFVQRTWITLHEKNIPHQYVEINPYEKDAEFLKLNPRGLVPTLAVPVDPARKEQKPLYESVVICEYLDEVYTDPTEHGPSLLPANAYERARCRIWIDHISGRIVPAFYRFMQHQHSDLSPYTLDEARAEFLHHIKTFVQEADPTGPFFLGDQFSMVDVMLAPWLCRLFLFDVFKGGLGIPAEGKGGADEPVWQRWRRWAKATEERQSVLDTLSERRQYIDAYRRYAEDTTQSQVAQATRAGRRLP
ncbi:glutathione S-transferase [Capronia epimyces CBS 606.96]|uniref:Glutathione S-transferase n=1 Tax=Capronia epimyces CBS 606.96 TaxID=1182542 RepID=W9YJ91_9EURO|nr:glutathione S-transferase [Capronia epimyces CBS 606.96]EXJ92952.1 glutathione S-transferase [Capronia epimyces CBS 606.96]